MSGRAKNRKQTGYEFYLPARNNANGGGGHVVLFDGDKMKFRFTDKPRVGGNGFGMGTENVSYTITSIDRHMVGVFR